MTLRTFALSLALLLAGPATAQVLDRVVAVVDDEVILESELNAQIQFVGPQQPPRK